jgi:hypothetical protein
MPALFIRDGDRLVPTGLARGGWAEDTQHGGPPCGVLASAIEATRAPVPMQTVRLTFDLFRPVPMAPLHTTTRIVRDGKRIQVIDAYLHNGEVTIARAAALRIRTKPTELPPHVAQLDRLAPGHSPADGLPVGDRWIGADDRLERFYVDAIEARSLDDSFIRGVPGKTWFRLKAQLVEGEETSRLVALATIADMANGNAAVLDPQEWLFVNPDLTLYIHRLPVGEWVGMDSRPHPRSTGVGVADTLVYDEEGAVGRIVQSQLIERHDGHRW